MGVDVYKLYTLYNDAVSGSIQRSIHPFNKANWWWTTVEIKCCGIPPTLMKRTVYGPDFGGLLMD